MSFTGTDALFIALDGPPVRGDPGDSRVVSEWVADLSARQHRVHAARLNNHQRWFVNARPGLEIEQKFTLAGRPDIWLLAARTRDVVGAGAIDGWIREHGGNGGFEQWDFLSTSTRSPARSRSFLVGRLLPARSLQRAAGVAAQRARLLDHVRPVQPTPPGGFGTCTRQKSSTSTAA